MDRGGGRSQVRRDTVLSGPGFKGSGREEGARARAGREWGSRLSSEMSGLGSGALMRSRLKRSVCFGEFTLAPKRAWI